MAAQANEIEIIRVYDAPVKLVWDAWTDLQHAEKWWGPRGFTLTTKSKELKPGGKWIYTMHGPDGTDYPNVTTYHVVEKYKKLVYDHGGNEDRPKLFTVTALFEEKKRQTTLTLSFALPTAQEAKAMKQFIKEANGNSTWDRLAEYLEAETSGKDIFVIHRSFETDMHTLFNMWAKPEHLAKWLAPKGATMKFHQADVREGGTSQWEMKSAEGFTMFGQIHYKTIRAPHTLIYSQSFTDAYGKPAKPAFAPTYPDHALTTVTFSEEGAHQSRVYVKWEVLGQASDEESDTFHKMKDGMTIGWNGSFDKLEELLKKS